MARGRKKTTLTSRPSLATGSRKSTHRPADSDEENLDPAAMAARPKPRPVHKSAKSVETLPEAEAAQALVSLQTRPHTTWTGDTHLEVFGVEEDELLSTSDEVDGGFSGEKADDDELEVDELEDDDEEEQLLNNDGMSNDFLAVKPTTQ